MFATAQTNPVAEFYPDGYPGWTDEIKWNNVINMATNSEILAVTGEWARYEKGVELLGTEGGVLYYPAGTYKFSDLPAGENGAKADGEGIMLRSGVVILGEKPATRQIASEIDKGDISLSTIFEFPLYDREVITTDDDNPVIKQTAGHWNFVGIKARDGETLKDVNNVGICFVNFKYGGVYWGAEYVWAESYTDPNGNFYGAAGSEAKNGWMKTRTADGTHYADPFGGCAKRNVNGVDGTEYVGAGEGRLILACRFDEAILMDAGGINGEYANGYNGGTKEVFTRNSLGPYRFAGRITIDASNVFVASTSITKPVTTPFLYKDWLQMASKDPINEQANQGMMLQVPQLFDPAKNIGIDVGKSILGLVSDAQRKMLDDKAPFYELNIVVRDCYVYNHGNKGYEASGRWVKMINNVNDRDYLDGGTIPSVSTGIVTRVGDAESVYGLTDAISYKIRTSGGTKDIAGVAGHYIARMSAVRGTNQTDDNMSRAFDMGGHNVWVDNNRYWSTGSWPGNDGEGILGQRSGSIEAFSWATTNNQALYPGGQSKSGYMATYDMHTVGAIWYSNMGEHSEWNAGLWGIKISSNNEIEEVSIINNTRNGAQQNATEGLTVGTQGGPIWTTGNYPGGTIKAPSNVKAEYNEEGNYTDVSWDPDYTIEGTTVTDNSKEVGYRVERRKQGDTEWQVVAYRPMQTGHKVLGGVNRTYKGQSSWTLEEMDLNPPVWRDYERINGVAEYRVVALGTEPANDVVQTEAPAVVDFGERGLVGIKNSVEKLNISVYPNPVGATLYLSKKADLVEVFSLNGACLIQQSTTSQLNVNTLAPGFYMVKIQLNGAATWAKIIKQ